MGSKKGGKLWKDGLKRRRKWHAMAWRWMAKSWLEEEGDGVQWQEVSSVVDLLEIVLTRARLEW